MTNTAPSTKEKFKTNYKDVYQVVTDTIIQQLEEGTIPWQQPWSGPEGSIPGLPLNISNGKRYRGINIVLLWSHAIKYGYQSNEWGTFKQWNDKGERIRKGAGGRKQIVIYYDTHEIEEDGEMKEIPYAKTFEVFNRCQLASYEAPPANTEIAKPTFEQLTEVEKFITNTTAIMEWHEGGACYIPSQDKIKMPFPENFLDTPTCSATEGYYSTYLHELTHWSGNEKRLNRNKGKKFGDNNYATEELVAEFGAAFLCAGFGINILNKGDHAGYIDHWLKVLKENNRCLFTAASEASKAVDYLYSLQPV